MIFKQWRQVLTGEKTETRRAVKPDQTLLDGSVYTTKIYGYYAIDGMGQRSYFNGHKDNPVYIVGKTYPVIPKMFQPAVWWRERNGVVEVREAVVYRPSFNGYHSETDYHNLTRVDLRESLAEQGYQQGRIRILSLRQEPLHDIDEAAAIREGVSSVDEYRDLWESINGKSRKYRWIANPLVNVIRFEAVRP